MNKSGIPIKKEENENAYRNDSVQKPFEFIACKKAEHYAQTFQNAELKTLAGELANCHKQRYDRLFNYLNSWQ